MSSISIGEPVQYNSNLSPIISPININNINNLIGNLLNLSNIGSVQFNNHTTQDVISTLDESDNDKLNIYTLSESKEEKCSVCMSELNIDENVCELPCQHIFHNNCIQTWLQQYNYKCPICRKEVGKPKHHI